MRTPSNLTKNPKMIGILLRNSSSESLLEVGGPEGFSVQGIAGIPPGLPKTLLVTREKETGGSC